MATKGKATVNPRSQKANVTRARAPAELKIGSPPASDDPKAQAEYFLAMLDAFAQQGTPEAKRLQSALIEAVSTYGRAHDKAEAAVVLRAKVAALEIGVAELLVRTTKKLRDRLVHESRKMGTASPLGGTTRAAAEGFSAMVDGLELLQKAAETNDAALREKAHQTLAQARASLARIG